MKPTLPQNDPDPQDRLAQLDEARSEYKYEYTTMTPLGIATNVPLRNQFAPLWLAKAGASALQILANHIAIEADSGKKAAQTKRFSLLGNLLKAVEMDADAVVRIVEEAVGAVEDSGQFASLEQYAQVFHTIDQPSVVEDWRSDASFAHARVAGPNPLVIRQVEKPPANFPVTEAHFQKALPGDSLAAAGYEGRLFLCDYQALKDVHNGDFPGGLAKYSHAPLALFATHKESRQLLPVAIQCGQQPGPANPVFTPDDSIDWLMARNVVQVADGNYHQAISHLGHTHMFIEPFVISTERQLASNHPLGILLRPHFQGTLAINNAAAKQLAAPGGSVDELLAGTIQSTVGLTAVGVDNYRVNDAMLPTALMLRGVGSPDVLRDYPYRDDAMLYWPAIREWVEAYLRLYYDSDQDVRQDTELRAWYQEIASRDGGRINGLELEVSAGTFHYLVDVATLLIFTSSVQHAAVNFAQYDPMTYIPGLPLACYQPARTSLTGATELDFLAMLSPKKPAMKQLALGFMLGTLHYGQLGQYESGAFPDKRVKGPLKDFQERLTAIGETIKERNLTRRPYTHLLAKGVPQSINV